MVPVATTDTVTAERSRRLEGFRSWSRRRNQATGRDVDSPRPVDGHRPSLRPAFGR